MWTLQKIGIYRDRIRGGGKYCAGWGHITDPAKLIAYRWMVQEMERKGIPMGKHSPVWAWKYERKEELLQGFLPPDEREHRAIYVLIKFEPKHKHCLESSYDCLSQLLNKHSNDDEKQRAKQNMFTPTDRADIQITLPWLCEDEILALDEVELRRHGRPIIRSYED